MPSVISGFEYDIFISYRHKDNKGQRWVTEFVDALKTELEATFKEDISIYFDENPHDGLLETHNVGMSLEGKLKCLIFIPIISQTYCDPKSFAWQNEFCVFNRLAKADEFGRDITLSNGNVASRILPVQIHVLDAADKTLLENELGSVLRAIELIYNSKGVNRPLSAREDHPHENINKTYYRDQINKVANAVKQILGALRNPASLASSNVHESFSITGEISTKRGGKKVLAWSVSILLVLSLGILIYFNWFPLNDLTRPIDRSIAVIPFTDLSENHDQEWFSDGMTEEILGHLYKVGEWEIVSRTSAMKYKGTKLSAEEIADELRVAHILEGSVRKFGNRVKISVQLIDGKFDRPLWSETYEREYKDVFAIQSDVAQQIASILKVKISSEVKQRIEARPVDNTDAYTLYLQLLAKWREGRRDSESDAKLLKKIIEMDPNFAPAYAKLGRLGLLKGSVGGFLASKDAIEEGLGFLKKAVSLDPDHPDAHIYLAWYYLWYRWDFESAGMEWQKVFELAPSDVNTDIVSGYSSFLSASGKFDEALKFVSRMMKIGESNQFWGQLSGSYVYLGQEEKALNALDSAEKYSPEPDNNLWNSIYTKTSLERYDLALPDVQQYFNKFPNSRIPYIMCYSAICYFKSGETAKGESLLTELIERSKHGPVGSPSYHIAQVYSSLEKKDQAFQWLQKALDDREIEMYWIQVETTLQALRGDPRWSQLISKMKLMK